MSGAPISPIEALNVRVRWTAWRAVSTFFRRRRGAVRGAVGLADGKGCGYTLSGLLVGAATRRAYWYTGKWLAAQSYQSFLKRPNFRPIFSAKRNRFSVARELSD